MKKSDYKYLNLRYFKYGYIEEIKNRIEKAKNLSADEFNRLSEKEKLELEVETPRRYLNFDGVRPWENPVVTTPSGGKGRPLRAENIVGLAEILCILAEPLRNVFDLGNFTANGEDLDSKNMSSKDYVPYVYSEDKINQLSNLTTLFRRAWSGKSRLEAREDDIFVKGYGTETYLFPLSLVSLPGYIAFPELFSDNPYYDKFHDELTKRHCPVLPVTTGLPGVVPAYAPNIPVCIAYILREIEINDEDVREFKKQEVFEEDAGDQRIAAKAAFYLAAFDTESVAGSLISSPLYSLDEDDLKEDETYIDYESAIVKKYDSYFKDLSAMVERIENIIQPFGSAGRGEAKRLIDDTTIEAASSLIKNNREPVTAEKPGSGLYWDDCLGKMANVFNGFKFWCNLGTKDYLGWGVHQIHDVERLSHAQGAVHWPESSVGFTVTRSVVDMDVKTTTNEKKDENNVITERESTHTYTIRYKNTDVTDSGLDFSESSASEYQHSLWTKSSDKTTYSKFFTYTVEKKTVSGKLYRVLECDDNRMTSVSPDWPREDTPTLHPWVNLKNAELTRAFFAVAYGTDRKGKVKVQRDMMLLTYKYSRSYTHGNRLYLVFEADASKLNEFVNQGSLDKIGADTVEDESDSPPKNEGRIERQGNDGSGAEYYPLDVGHVSNIVGPIEIKVS